MLLLVAAVALAQQPHCKFASETTPCCKPDKTCTPRTNFVCVEATTDCGENCTVALSAELQTPCPDGSGRSLIGLDCYACPKPPTTSKYEEISSPPPLEVDVDINAEPAQTEDADDPHDHGHDVNPAQNEEVGDGHDHDHADAESGSEATESSGLSDEAIVGIVLGAVALVVIGAFALS